MGRGSRTRYVLLGVLAGGPKTGYEIKRMIDESIGHFWSESYGRIYPGLERGSPTPGSRSADLLVGPSNDWPEVARTHMEMATFRAIEQGVSPVRPTTGGSSVATDPYGRTLASMDDARSDERSGAALVPMRGIGTVYTRIGDLFARLSLVGLVGLVGAALRWIPCGLTSSDR
ncbi:MAG: hypothetical protein ACOC8B_04355 [Gemmatimonadota bacterium]